MIFNLKIQAVFSGSSLTKAPLSFNFSFTSIISPSMGVYISDAALTDSITQTSSFDETCFPIVGNSTNTISPRLS